jgi:hypothetical protein
VDVIQFLPVLLFSANVEGVKAAVPKAEVGLIMDLSVSLIFGWTTEIQGIHGFSPKRGGLMQPRPTAWVWGSASLGFFKP